MLCTAAMYHVNVIIFNCVHVRPLVRRPNTCIFPVTSSEAERFFSVLRGGSKRR